MTMRRIAIAIAGATASLLIGPLAGCSGLRTAWRGDSALTPGGSKSAEVFPGDAEAVAEACRLAMADFSIKQGTPPAPAQAKVDAAVAKTKTDGAGGPVVMTGKTADGRPVSVEVRSVGARAMASVQVGRNGDVPYARALLDRVGLHMGIKPPDPLNEAPSPPPPSLSNPLFAKDAVPNSEMLRDQVRSAYRDSPVPY
jgi:hypothetical protein